MQQLEIGEVGAPLDSPFGVQIIRRTPLQKRRSHAMESLQIGFDPSLPDADPQSRASALAQLENLFAIASQEPARFAEFQQQLCCLGVESWQAGRDSVHAERALDWLGVGQLSAPIQLHVQQYAVLRRLPAAIPAPPAPSFELP